MKRVNVADAKAHLSAYLREVKNGETLVICERNVPIAEMRAIGASEAMPPNRPFGLFKSDVELPRSLFAPMADEEVEAWEGSPTDSLEGEPSRLG